MRSRRHRFGAVERLAVGFALALAVCLIAPNVIDLGGGGDHAASESAIRSDKPADAAPLTEERSAATRAAAPPIDPDDLSTLPDDRLNQAVLDIIYWSIGDDWARQDEILAELPPGYRLFFAMSLIENDVRRAGFVEAAFWGNDLLGNALTGYRLIGAEDHAAIVDEVLALIQFEGLAWEECLADPACDDVTDDLAWNEFDSRWFATEAGGEGLEALRADYVRDHPEQFAGDW